MLFGDSSPGVGVGVVLGVGDRVGLSCGVGVGGGGILGVPARRLEAEEDFGNLLIRVTRMLKLEMGI